MIWLNDKMRRAREEDGFTLIELMVVVLIIGILIAIAIPTFLGARKRAQDRAAQSNLRQTVTAAKTVFTDRETYCDVVNAQADGSGACGGTPTTKFTTSEPSITFQASNVSSTGPPEVSLNATDKDHFFAAAFSKANKCWYVRDVTISGADAGTQWAVTDPSTNTTCTAASAPANGWTKDIGSL